jgi:DNA gyrase subunit A
MGLVAAGVMSMKLQSGDEIAGMDLLPKSGEVFLLSDNGYAKRIKFDQFPKQGRHGQGVGAWKLTAKEAVIGVVIGKGTTRLVLRMSKLLPKTIRLDEAPIQGRAARGASILELKAGNHIIGITLPWEPRIPEATKVRSRLQQQSRRKTSASKKP